MLLSSFKPNYLLYLLKDSRLSGIFIRIKDKWRLLLNREKITLLPLKQTLD